MRIFDDFEHQIACHGVLNYETQSGFVSEVGIS